MRKHPRFRKKNKKKQVFLKLKIFFILRNNHILKKVNTFSESYVENNGNVTPDTFLDLTDVSSYLFLHVAYLFGY